MDRQREKVPERVKDRMAEQRETVTDEKTEREGLFCRKHRCVRKDRGDKQTRTKKKETQGHAGEEIGNK